MAIVEVSHLKKYYGAARGIEDVSFSVEEGEFFGFIGPNGAGKSTTIRTLLALIRPTAGSATLFGKDSREKRARDRPGRGVPPQRGVLLRRHAGGRPFEILRQLL